MKHLILILTLLPLGVAGGAQAQATAQDFCAQVEALGVQPTCRVDYMHDVRLVRKYLRLNGLIDDDGVKIIAMGISIFNWRNLLTQDKTPAWIIGHCDEKDSTTGWLDFRIVWDCIVENDPDAALLEAI